MDGSQRGLVDRSFISGSSGQKREGVREFPSTFDAPTALLGICHGSLLLLVAWRGKSVSNVFVDNICLLSQALIDDDLGMWEFDPMRPPNATFREENLSGLGSTATCLFSAANLGYRTILS